MFELLSGGLLGSIFGGLFRLAPEVLKFLDKKNERQHELNMFQLQTDLEKMRGTFKMEESMLTTAFSNSTPLKRPLKNRVKRLKQQVGLWLESLPWYALESPGRYLACTLPSRRLRLFLRFKAMHRGMK